MECSAFNQWNEYLIFVYQQQKIEQLEGDRINQEYEARYE